MPFEGCVARPPRAARQVFRYVRPSTTPLGQRLSATLDGSDKLSGCQCWTTFGELCDSGQPSCIRSILAQ
eukprot:387346-Hanusia_phi.AAC.1